MQDEGRDDEDWQEVEDDEVKICVPLLLVHLSCLSNCSEPRGLKDAVSPHRPLASSSCANADLFQQQLLHILTPLMLHLSCTFSWLFHEDLEMEKSAKKQFSLPINNMMFFLSISGRLLNYIRLIFAIYGQCARSQSLKEICMGHMMFIFLRI